MFKTFEGKPTLSPSLQARAKYYDMISDLRKAVTNHPARNELVNSVLIRFIVETIGGLTSVTSEQASKRVFSEVLRNNEELSNTAEAWPVRGVVPMSDEVQFYADQMLGTWAEFIGTILNEDVSADEVVRTLAVPGAGYFFVGIDPEIYAEWMNDWLEDE